MSLWVPFNLKPRKNGMKNKKHTNPDPDGERPQAESPEPDGKLEARAETLAGIVAVNNFQGVQVLLHKRVSDKNN